MLSQKISMYMLDAPLEDGDDMNTIVADAQDTALEHMVEEYAEKLTEPQAEKLMEMLDEEGSLDQIEQFFLDTGVVEQSVLEDYIMDIITYDLGGDIDVTAA
jgi:hypothetical protein